MNKPDENEKASDDFIKEVEAAFLLVSKIIAIFLIGIGLSIVIYQLWFYFDSNTWKPVTIISMLVYMGVEWAKSPGSFLFVHDLLNLLPLSLLFLVLAVIQYLSGLLFVKKIEQAIKAVGLKSPYL